MPDTPNDPFQADAFATNREGRLSADQRHGLSRVEMRSRLNRIGAALVSLALAAAVVWQGRTDSLAAVYYVVAAVLIVAAGGFVYLGVVYRDALALDLREGRVEVVEGATGKHTRVVSAGRDAPNNYFVEVDGRSFHVSRDGYGAAPDAGWVRAFVLPNSHRLVNLERLPNRLAAPGPTSRSARQMAAARLSDAVGAQDLKAINEARAEIAAITESMADRLTGVISPPPPEERDPRPLEEAIIGTWRTGPATLTFRSDGTMSATSQGERASTGTWSVDRNGRLVSSATGQHVAADAWVACDELTIADGDRGLTFKRVKPK